MQPSVSISYGVPRLAATSVRQPPTIGPSATPPVDGQHVRVVGILRDAAERLGLQARWNVSSVTVVSSSFLRVKRRNVGP